MDIHEALRRVELFINIDESYGSDWEAWQMVKGRAVAPGSASANSESAPLCEECGTPLQIVKMYCPTCKQ